MSWALHLSVMVAGFWWWDDPALPFWSAWTAPANFAPTAFVCFFWELKKSWPNDFPAWNISNR
jgi:hypothetical protein